MVNDDELFIGLLDLPKDAIISIDGQSIVLKTDDFLGISKGERLEFHLIAVKGQSTSTLTSAFLLHPKHQSVFARRYDPQTEEMSTLPVDKLTQQNLQQQLPQLAHTSRVVGYSHIVSETQSEQWKLQTNFIKSSDILRIRGIETGEKIVPGCAQDDTDDDAMPQQQQQDGISISYPPIPVVDSNLSIWQTRHAGTKRYLSLLPPAARTGLFVDSSSSSSIANRLFEDILQKTYAKSWQAMVGDLQLSYTMFLYVHCFSSLEHWKDLVAMICLVDFKGMTRHEELYRAVIQVLYAQLITMEQGFLEDMEEAGNNFLLPLLKKFCLNLSKSNIVEQTEWTKFQSLLTNRFPVTFTNNNDFDDGIMMDHVDFEDDDEDAPVIVSTEDIQASLARSAVDSSSNSNTVPMNIKQKYPLLVAAMMPREDILMACARALDDKTDVSLVREAAAYLEQIEQRK